MILRQAGPNDPSFAIISRKTDWFSWKIQPQRTAMLLCDHIQGTTEYHPRFIIHTSGTLHRPSKYDWNDGGGLVRWSTCDGLIVYLTSRSWNNTGRRRPLFCTYSVQIYLIKREKCYIKLLQPPIVQSRVLRPPVEKSFVRTHCMLFSACFLE